MEQLIQSMLKITRIDAGSIYFEKSNYSIPNIINHAISELTTRADNEKKEIVIDGDLEQIGHSYFCNLQPDTINDDWLYGVLEYELIPLLKEYWFDEPMKVKDWSENLRSAIK